MKYAQIYLLTLYFCLPKIDLINFSNFPTGLRTQDIIALILFYLNFKIIKKILINIDNIYFIIFSSVIFYNLFIGNSLNTIVVVSRVFEYFVIGLSVYKIKEIKYLFYIIISLNLLLALMQKIQLIPVIDPIRGHYFSQTMNGAFGTPAEFSYFLIFILFILTRYLKNKYLKFLFPIALENSISASFFSAIFLFDYKKFLRLSLVPIYFYSFIFFTFSLGNAITFSMNTYYAIINQTSKQVNYNSGLKNKLNKINPINNYKIPDKNANNEPIKNANNEPISLRYRTEKWKLAIKNFLHSNPVTWIFGLGINKTGPLDGGLIKYLCEYGLSGLFFFISLSKRISFNAVGLIIAVNLAFDAFVSSVISPLIILIYFYEIYKKS